MSKTKKNRERGGEVVVDGATLLRIYNAHITKLDELIAAVDENDVPAKLGMVQGLLETRLLRGFQVSGLTRKKTYTFYPHEFTALFYVNDTFVPGIAAILDIPMRDHRLLRPVTQPQEEPNNTLD